MKTKTVGIIGAGKFGLALAKLLAPKCDVILYSRRISLIEEIEKNKHYKGIPIASNVLLTNSLEE